eukprot:1082275-Prorocentrum_lima.AAC.1
MLLQCCEEKVPLSICCSTFYVVNVCGDETDKLWAVAAVLVCHRLRVLIELSPYLLVLSLIHI